MTLRSKFIILTLGLTTLFLVLMIHDRVRTARKGMLDRAEDRAAYIVSFITDMSAGQLEADLDKGFEKILKGFDNFAQIAYLKVSDSKGKVIYRMGHPGILVDDRKPDADIFSSPDDIYDTAHDIVRDGRYRGSVKLGISMEGIKDSLEVLMWRGIVMGLLFLSLIGAAVWVLTVRLGRRFSALMALAGSVDSETLPPTPEMSPDGETGKVVSALRELHSRLKTEEKLRREAETQKEDFFAMTVHDLKQPLTSLKAAIDLLFSEEDRKSFTEEQIRGLSNIARTSLRMLNTMVVDILNTAKLNSRDYAPEKERISLSGLMRDCADENAISVKSSGKKWLFSMPEDIGEAWVFGEYDMLKRVVGNLVLNAIQYTPEGGSIKLGLRFLQGDKAAIYVSDEGEGIPDSFREEIFKKYSGMGKSSKNMGLGLAFCRLVAEAHSAKMDVRSKAGKGTEVSFVIPVSRGATGKQ
jgi:signal transduction histidine kinase